jgi:hypothetical protein
VISLRKGWTVADQLPFPELANPDAVAVDGSGNVYVADAGANRVLELPHS